MQTWQDLSLGSFGDRRLDKGGRRFSKAWCCAKQFACASLPAATILKRSGTGAFLAMKR